MRVLYVRCGLCGKIGAHVREPWRVEREIMKEDKEWANRVVSCRYCKVWEPQRPGVPLAQQAMDWKRERPR